MPPNPTALAPVARHRPDAGRDRSTAAGRGLAARWPYRRVGPRPLTGAATPPRRTPAAATDRTVPTGADDGGQS